MTATIHAPLNRSISLNYHGKSNITKKKRPNTWTCHFNRYTISPRVSKWVSQHKSKRETIATISTLTTTNSDVTTIVVDMHLNMNNDNSIFHTQSLLFLFGFLYFPCWWIGGYYLKVQDNNSKQDIEHSTMTVHSSLLANGKTCLKQLPTLLLEHQDTRTIFYKWNRCMSLISIGLTMIDIALIVWYFIVYY